MVELRNAPAVNKKLFTRRYLDKHLPNSEVWQKEVEKAESAWNELKKIYEEQKDELPNRRDNEEGLRDKFISEILERVLNFKYEKEQPTPDASIPDYGLFESDEDRRDALDKRGKEDFYKNAIAILEAKAWEKKLEMKKAGGGIKYDENNPVVQIMEYLFHSKPKWGILTNGRRWRLYHQEASSNRDTYYEVDLVDLLENNNFDEFRYFYFLFRKEAYTGREGRKYIDRVRTKSNRYAKEIGDDLKENVYQALLWLSKGMVDVGTNDLDPREDSKKIHDESLIFLYRLLFLFYVDSRDIMEDPAKQGHSKLSFPKLVDDILDDIESKDVEKYSVTYWNKLKEIFSMVNKGSEYMGIPKEDLFIPPYNGKLFSSEEHEFLEENKIRDQYIAKVIKFLAQRKSGEQVDYADLSVRHLGEIYEGLLEYELHVAPERMVVEDGKWKNLDEASTSFKDVSDDEKAKQGEFYLKTEDNERRATGSYYTPENIVRSIVESTVEKKIKDLVDEDVPDEENRQAILTIDVLDPAMGSGHFLVEAIDKISSYLIKYSEEKTLNEVKREVARKCVYGVDLNPLATELAKVSIWLNTISEEKPLSFLDHHLKTGDSLIGADIYKIDDHPEEDSKNRKNSKEDKKNNEERQATLGEKFGDDNAGVVRANVKEMLKKFREIQKKKERSPDDIKEQEEIYKEFLNFPFRKRFEIIADVYTSYYFGNDYNLDDYNRLLQAMKLSEEKDENDPEWEDLVNEDWVKEARNEISKDAGFFHWKLEFPEVFFDVEEGKEKGNSGFDVVIGNPPYIDSEHMVENMPIKREYISENYDYASGNWDIYCVFLELGIENLREGGDMGYIIPNKILAAEYAEKSRENLSNLQVEEIVDYSRLDVFDVDVYPIILTLNNRLPNDPLTAVRMHEKDGALQEKFEHKIEYSNIKKLGHSSWTPLLSESFEIFKKIAGLETQDVDLEVSGGATVSEAYEIKEILNDSSKENVNPKGFKLVNTGTIEPWHTKWGLKPTTYIKDEYLEPYVEKSDLREISEKRVEQAEESKIVLGGMGKQIKCLVDDGEILAAKSTSLITSNKYNLYNLAGLLNSKVSSFVLLSLYQDLGLSGGYITIGPPQIREILGRTVNEKLQELDSKSIKKYGNKIREKSIKRLRISTDIQDYLVNYSKSKTLGDIYRPVEGVSETILAETQSKREKLRLGEVEFDDNKNELIMKVSVRFKPENKEKHSDLDSNGYKETQLIPAMKFSDERKELIKSFVPWVFESEEGDFKKDTGKTISPIDRLKAITLPKLTDVQDDLNRYLEEKKKAEELEGEIKEMDHQIDAIVFDLYDLTKEEVETVLDSLDTPEDEKKDIMEKFREI